jgi:hypothetical protein
VTRQEIAIFSRWPHYEAVGMTARKAAVRLIAAIVLMEQRMAGEGRTETFGERRRGTGADLA